MSSSVNEILNGVRIDMTTPDDEIGGSVDREGAQVSRHRVVRVVKHSVLCPTRKVSTRRGLPEYEGQAVPLVILLQATGAMGLTTRVFTPLRWP